MFGPAVLASRIKEAWYLKDVVRLRVDRPTCFPALPRYLSRVIDRPTSFLCSQHPSHITRPINDTHTAIQVLQAAKHPLHTDKGQQHNVGPQLLSRAED